MPLAKHTKNVLLKGGHLSSETVTDILITNGKTFRFQSDRIQTRHTHGTGCTLSAAICAGLSQGLSLYDAVAKGRDYVHQAISSAPQLGAGHGPLNHHTDCDSRWSTKT